jgi:hypothetical protein
VHIEWVNHASFLLTRGEVALLCDPWLDGTAFDDGWLHLSPTRWSPADWARVTHLWFSHEHPDHFSPSNVRAIPPAERTRIEVLYQRSLDQKVIKFCSGLGFKAVTEMTPGAWRTLGPGVEARVDPWRDGDSWMALRAGGRTLLNINDCVVKSRQDAEVLRRAVGPVDVLFTQFSYANWVGNPGDVAGRRAQAREKLERIRVQAEVLRPRQLVPFASFVWFCHEENDWLNDEVNRIEDVVEFVRTRTGAEPIVLYPGDRWEVGTPRDPGPAVERYRADFATLPSRPRIHTPPVPLEELEVQSRRYAERITRRNDPLVLRLVLQPSPIHLSDLDQVVELRYPQGLVRADRPREACDIRLSSAALSYCFRFPWGGDTLHVNGRFTKPPRGRWKRFSRHFSPAVLNNRGLRFGLAEAAKQALARLAR